MALKTNGSSLFFSWNYKDDNNLIYIILNMLLLELKLDYSSKSMAHQIINCIFIVRTSHNGKIYLNILFVIVYLLVENNKNLP